MKLPRLAPRTLIAAALAAVVLLSAVAVHQVMNFRGSVMAAAAAAHERALADELLFEFVDFETAARAYRLTKDRRVVESALEARRRGEDALTVVERGAHPTPALSELAVVVRWRLGRLLALAQGSLEAEPPPEEMRRRLDENLARLKLARGLVARIAARETELLDADDRGTPWDERGRGVVAAIVALAGLSALALIAGFRALTQEVGARQAAETEARESHRQLEQILDASPDLVCLKDRGSHILWANRAACEFSGTSLEDLKGRRAAKGLRLKEIRAYLKDDAVALEGRGTHETVYEDFARTDGVPRAMHAVRMPIFDASGEPTTLVLFARDITEQRAAERRLRAAEAEAREKRLELQQILDASPNLVILKDRDSRILWANRAFCEFKGIRREDLRAFADRVDPEAMKRYLAADRRVIETRKAVEEPVVWSTRLDGSPIAYHTVKTPVFDEAGEVILLVTFMRDCTEELERQDEIQKAHKLLERSNQELESEVQARSAALRKSEESLRQAQKMEAVGRLAGGVAHDFNNILTVIQGYAAFLAGHGDALVRSDAREIQDAVERAAGVTRQLLQFGRRRPPERQRPLALNEAVSSVERLLVRVIGETVRVETRLDASRPRACAEPADLEQVLLNLAVNARDAMPRGGRLLIETGVLGLMGDAALPDGKYACLTVTDEGTGIVPDLQAKIFEPFFTTKGPDKGTGLGLATVYAIARRLGGDARVESEPGKGASFRVLLPLAVEGMDAAEDAGAASSRGDGPPARSGAVVLLVEDQESLRRMAARALREAGYAVIEAGDAAQALVETADPARRVDVLLSDVVMPGMRGPELAARLLSERPGLKALLMSGYLDDAGAPVELPSGVPLLRKPVAPSAVAAAVDATLASPAAA